MSDTNPYEAPRSEIGPGFGAGDVATALADFTRSRAPMLGVAFMLGFMALVGLVSTMYAFGGFTGNLGGAMSITFLFLGVSVGGNLLGAGAVLWLRQVLAGLGPSTTVEQLTTALRRLGNFWLLAAILWCAPALANVAMSVGLWMIPVLGTAVAGLPRDNALLAAAERWRNMVRICLAAGGALILLKVGAQVFSPFAATGLAAVESRVWLVGGVLMQLALGTLAWRQVPALEAFVAQPTPATLTLVAATHRTFWRVTAWGAVAVAAFNALSTVVMNLLF
ncbi:MAG: hypothetical protein ACAI38_10890 [Myxococcota bacterium]